MLTVDVLPVRGTAPRPPYRGPVPGPETVDRPLRSRRRTRSRPRCRSRSTRPRWTACAHRRVITTSPGPGSKPTATTCSACWCSPRSTTTPRRRSTRSTSSRTLDRLVTVRKTPPGDTACDFDAIRDAALRNGSPRPLPLLPLRRDRRAVPHDGRRLRRRDRRARGQRRRLALDSRCAGQISHIRHDILEVRRALAPTRDAARAVLDDRVELDGDVTLFPVTSSCTSPTPTTSCCARPTASTSLATCSRGVRDFHQAEVAQRPERSHEAAHRRRVGVAAPDVHRRPLRPEPQRRRPSSAGRNGYLFSWCLIIVTTIAQLVYFRRKHWI